MMVLNPLDLRGGSILLASLLVVFAPSVLAHGDHGHVPEGSAVSGEPLVRWLGYFILYNSGDTD